MENIQLEQEQEKDEPILHTIEELKEVVNYYKTAMIDNKNIQIDVMFVKKRSNKTHKTFMLACSNESLKTAVEGTLDNMLHILGSRFICEYDLDVSLDNTVQTVEGSKVIHGKELLDNITVDYTDENTLNENINFDTLDFLVMNISSTSEDKPSITFFKKHLAFTSKYKNSVRGTFNGKEFKALDKKILMIGSNIDAMYIDGFYYITNRNSFNSMLDFKDVFSKIVDDNNDSIVNSGLLSDPDKFVSDCKGNGRYLPRLTKAILAKGFENVKNNHHKLPSLIKKHNLSLKVTDKGKIEYVSDDVNEILNLLLQHYVTSDLTEKSLIAKAIEKYE